MASLLRPKKNTYNHKKLSSLTIGYIQTSTKQAKRKVKNKLLHMQILLDSSCRAILINKKFINNSKSTKDKKTRWTTKAGNFNTNRKCEVDFTLPAFNAKKIVSWNCYVDESDNSNNNYDMIIGRDILHELGIDLMFSTAEMT